MSCCLLSVRDSHLHITLKEFQVEIWKPSKHPSLFHLAYPLGCGNGLQCFARDMTNLVNYQLPHPGPIPEMHIDWVEDPHSWPFWNNMAISKLITRSIATSWPHHRGANSLPFNISSSIHSVFHCTCGSEKWSTASEFASSWYFFRKIDAWLGCLSPKHCHDRLSSLGPV